MVSELKKISGAHNFQCLFLQKENREAGEGGQNITVGMSYVIMEMY